MTAKDRPVSKPATDAFRENFDRIFGKKPAKEKWRADGLTRGDIELKIVEHLLKTAKEFGWECTHVDNGGGWEPVGDGPDVPYAIDEAFAADEAWLLFRKEGCRNQFVELIFGNDGYDVIVDNTMSDAGGWDQMMGAVDEYAESFDTDYKE